MRKDEDVTDTVMLASYPRSGNTMTRDHLQGITGILTGDYHNLDDVNGKKVIQPTDFCKKHLMIMKTHHPMDEKICVWQRALVLVRNPLDVMVSYFNY